MKTEEQLFCGNVHDRRRTALLTVRPGMPADDALERAALLCHTVGGALRHIASNTECPSETGLYFSLANELETADALIHSVLGQVMRAKKPQQDE